MSAPPVPEEQSGAGARQSSAHSITLGQQQAEAFHWLAEGKRTVMQGVEALRTPNLRTIVSELEKKGITVARDWIKHSTASGVTVALRRYWLDPGVYAATAPRIRVRGR